MAGLETPAFNQPDHVVEGWYWAIESRKVRSGRAKPVTLIGRDLVVWRGRDGKARCGDAYCPHMGCHLAIGKVDGDGLRCFFHGWRFNGEGACDHIPALNGVPPKPARLRMWHCEERFGMIWVWIGAGEPTGAIPTPPGLMDKDIAGRPGYRFDNPVHPHVLMANAIDEQHFNEVHDLPGDRLRLEDEQVGASQIFFRNTAPFPRDTWLQRFAARFYDETLYYDLCYWYGSNGTASFGPKFLPLHMILAMRPTPEGRTEGRMILVRDRKTTILGRLANEVAFLTVTVMMAFFRMGDRSLFKTLRYRLGQPIAADRSILRLAQFIDQQPRFDAWRDNEHRVREDQKITRLDRYDETRHAPIAS